MDSLWWDLCCLVFGILGDILQLVLLLWLSWRELGRIIEEKIEDAIDQVSTGDSTNA